MGRPKKAQQEENKKILEHVRKFRKNQCPDSFDVIAESLKGFIEHLSKYKFFYVPGHSSDDLYQEALYALSNKAIPDYVEEKGPFLAFAKLCVRRHIITILKSSNNNRHKILNTSLSIDAPVSDSDDDGPMCIGNYIENNEESIEEQSIRQENTSRLKNLLTEKLTPLENQVLIFYLKNLSYQDIVIEMNRRRRGKNRVDAKTVDNALCRIKKKALEIREELARDSDEEDEDLFFFLQ